ncbi:hypothetical protein ACTXT7_013399 [Hymenolepis weldensis]
MANVHVCIFIGHEFDAYPKSIKEDLSILIYRKPLSLVVLVSSPQYEPLRLVVPITLEFSAPVAQRLMATGSMSIH